MQLSQGLGVCGLLRLFELTASGDVAIDFQDRRGVSLPIAYECLAAFHHKARAITLCMDEFSLPIPFVCQISISSSHTDGKYGLQQTMGDPSERLLLTPTVEFFGSLVPRGHTT